MTDPSKTTKMDDRSILLGVIEKWRKIKTRPRLSPTRFEKAFNLEPLPDIFDKKELVNVLNVNPFWTQPKGKKFKDLLSSLIPVNENMFSTDPILRKALVYVLGRFVFRIPKNRVQWTNYPKGLDYLTTALFSLYELECILEMSIDWLSELNKKKTEQYYAPEWELLTLRPDGPTVQEGSGIVNRMRPKVRSLRYKPVIQACENFRDKTAFSSVSWGFLRDQGLSRGESQQAWSSLQLLLTERFIPSLSHLGLRYRLKFTELFRDHFPLGPLCETLSLNKKGYGGLRIYVEPDKTEKPIESGSFDIVSNQQILSMRMDFYCREKNKWNLGVFDESDDQPKDTPGWLYSETSQREGEPKSLSELERHILSIVWGHRGTQSQRHVLLETMGVRASRSQLSRLVNKTDLKVLHYPSLEYAGLPDGLVVAVRDASPQEVVDLTFWLIRSFPFVRLYRDTARGSLLAVIRLPEYRGNFFSSMIGSKLSELGLDHITTTVMKQRTFYMTTFSRIQWSNS
jgi:hypothetical protein